MALLSLGCRNSEHQSEDRLAKEIYTVHDAVMPKSADIVRMQKKLNKLYKKKETLSAAAVSDIEAALRGLEAADDGMMLWMGDFKAPAKLRSSKTHEEIMAYLESEMAEIRQVSSDMLASLEQGAAVLAKWEQP